MRLGATLFRTIADAGYKGHNAPPTHRFKVYTAGQKRGMTEAIKREMRRRSAVEPVNAILAAVGYNFRRVLASLRLLLAIIGASLQAQSTTNPSLQI